MEASKVVVKKRRAWIVHGKYLQLGKDANSFKIIFDGFMDQDLPSPWDYNNDLYPLQNYQELLI